jgi:hypothetical protein
MTLEEYLTIFGALSHDLGRGQLNQLIFHINVHTALVKLRDDYWVQLKIHVTMNW